MITIHLNEQPLNIDENVNISQLLHQENYPQIGIAVAINQHIISKSNWDDQLLQDGDNILIIQATQGG
ncbi:sulfur carrier protein ThiS [Aestuariibaculum suncheonense]|uniref:Sulfur carrier protein ThiS n=1 Tax=Aestuariibaculum suncheonense TaxID=1028745 RepID=A0A8J6Q9K1_9FLAO|nr:sulfur carrier protein ThiS [Aestuariibaculum suncheonense]MBD0836738.1 sulfur carrier protein ThiS [Aestuariibaculum suncheonense]